MAYRGSALPQTTETAPEAPPAAPEPAEIDMQALAEQVYRLLREELRLERERLGPRSARRRGG
jgi:hypothetical protein